MKTPLHDVVAHNPMLGPPTGIDEDKVAVITRAPGGHRRWVVAHTHLTLADAHDLAGEARALGFEANVLTFDSRARERATDVCENRNAA